MNNIVIKHENKRKKVWIKAWCATANANNTVSVHTCNRYANTALEEFDKIFPKPIVTKSI